jgi:hypothetical protein
MPHRSDASNASNARAGIQGRISLARSLSLARPEPITSTEPGITHPLAVLRLQKRSCNCSCWAISATGCPVTGFEGTLWTQDPAHIWYIIGPYIRPYNVRQFELKFDIVLSPNFEMTKQKSANHNHLRDLLQASLRKTQEPIVYVVVLKPNLDDEVLVYLLPGVLFRTLPLELEGVPVASRMRQSTLKLPRRRQIRQVDKGIEHGICGTPRRTAGSGPSIPWGLRMRGGQRW